MIRKRLCKSFAVIAGLVLLAALCACSNRGQNEPPLKPPSQAAAPETSPDISPIPAQQIKGAFNPAVRAIASGKVIVTFDYKRQSGTASNQFAVWIEDMDGQLVKTLYATRFTASGGYKDRPDSLALWVEKSGLAAMTKSEVDAITGATPKAGNLSYTWDLTDVNGGVVSPGAYQFFVEGTLRWKNVALYSGVITIGDAPATVQADTEFTYVASDKQAALTSDSPENSMISTVTASFIPQAMEESVTTAQ